MQQGGLLAARVQFDRGQTDAAKTSLTWVADNASEEEYRSVARLRLAGLLLQAKDYDGSEAAGPPRRRPSPRWWPTAAATCCWPRASGRSTQRYQAAWKAMDEKVEYRRLVDAKLTALGAAPTSAAKASGAGQ